MGAGCRRASFRCRTPLARPKQRAPGNAMSSTRHPKLGTMPRRTCRSTCWPLRCHSPALGLRARILSRWQGRNEDMRGRMLAMAKIAQGLYAAICLPKAHARSALGLVITGCLACPVSPTCSGNLFDHSSRSLWLHHTHTHRARRPWCNISAHPCPLLFVVSPAVPDKDATGPRYPIVHQLVAGGAAEASGKVGVGDEILAVDSVPTLVICGASLSLPRAYCHNHQD